MLLTISICLSTSYISLLLFFIRGWAKLKDDTPRQEITASNIFVTVLFAFRNEEHNLPALIQSLRSQTLNPKFFEIIAVNDHSTDNSTEVLANSHLQNLKALNMPMGFCGKKQAISYGLEMSKGKLIITTDADCTHSHTWLESHLNHYNKHRSQLTIGPVDMRTGGKIWNELQAIEFISLTSSSAGAAANGNAMYCNAANMAFEKECFKHDMLNNKETSGDDVFLLHSIKKNGGKISVLYSQQAFTYTHAARTLKEFINQRARWSSKSRSYSDTFTLTVAFFIFAYNIAILSFIFINWACGLLLFLSKFTADCYFFKKTLHFYNKQKLIYHVPALSTIYPFYITITALLGLTGSYSWKERKHTAKTNSSKKQK